MSNILPKDYFFTEIQTKLLEEFKNRHYSAHKMDLIYNAIKYLHKYEFDKIINEFVGNSKFLPTVKEFSEKAHLLLENRVQNIRKENSKQFKRQLSEKQERDFFKTIITAISKNGTDPIFEKIDAYMAKMVPKVISCQICFDSGTVQAKRNGSEDMAPFAFKCKCKIGMSIPEKWPEWDQRTRHNFTSVYEVKNKES